MKFISLGGTFLNSCPQKIFRASDQHLLYKFNHLTPDGFISQPRLVDNRNAVKSLSPPWGVLLPSTLIHKHFSHLDFFLLFSQTKHIFGDFALPGPSRQPETDCPQILKYVAPSHYSVSARMLPPQIGPSRSTQALSFHCFIPLRALDTNCFCTTYVYVCLLSICIPF